MKIADVTNHLDKQSLPALLNAAKGLEALKAVLPHELYHELELDNIGHLISWSMSRGPKEVA
jgi:hypothetical protein